MQEHEQLCSAAGIQKLAKEWWDCVVSDKLAEELSAEYVKHRKKSVEAALAKVETHSAVGVGVLVWLKARLNEENVLPTSAPASDDTPDPVTAVLHVGFVMLAETEEMLERLHNEALVDDANNPARSKMFDTAQKQNVTPIDALAGIVGNAGWQKEK